MPGRTNPEPAIKVTFYDPARHRSVTITAYGARLEDIAWTGIGAIEGRYRTTNVSDRRHKRRL